MRLKPVVLGYDVVWLHGFFLRVLLYPTIGRAESVMTDRVRKISCRDSHSLGGRICHLPPLYRHANWNRLALGRLLNGRGAFSVPEKENWLGFSS
jgi:hypothetical protein